MNPKYPAVAERALHRCEYCHAPEAIFNFPFEVEHILPSNRQGGDHESNLALACRACNLRKSDRQIGWDVMTGSEERLFHPRVDTWAEHFSVDSVSCQIVGQTPIGRATVQRLAMNAPAQVEARRAWTRLGLFP